jgi:hypothetical protein
VGAPRRRFETSPSGSACRTRPSGSHSNSKQDLLAAVLESQEEAFADVLASASDSPQQFLDLVIRFFRDRESAGVARRCS